MDNTQFSDPNISAEDKRSVIEMLGQNWEMTVPHLSPISWGGYGGMVWALCLMTKKRKCGSTAPPKRSTVAHNMRWQSTSAG